LNLKLGIITNGFAKFQMNNIRGLKIDSYFDEILISELEGVRKPEIEIFTRAVNRLGIEPHEAIYVGDHPVNDVEASIRAGMIGVWKENKYFDKPSVNCLSIKNLEQLINILESISE